MDQLLTDIVSLLRILHPVLYVFTWVVAASLLLGGLDDIVVDLFYWFQFLFRRKQLLRYQLLSPDDMLLAPEKPIAVFVPAWHEHDVIEQMLTRACASVNYDNYEIFVGVYPNDPGTQERVAAAARRFPRIHAVVAGHPGPSTKAQNLNDIHQGMLRWENLTGKRYEIIVQHDAEDLIHPLELKVFNAFIPDHDMVQLPVFPLATPQRKVVHWTYCDEFAENHTKDLMARQVFSGFIPSAGVGTGYNRWLIEFAGTSYARNLFNRGSLTEDYDIALRLALAESRLLYVYRPFGKDIATWAYFPQTFSTAVRQRTRWLIGICLQAWRNYGWRGNARFRLTLYRDRKAVIANIVNALAYVVLVYVLLYEIAQWGLARYGDLEPLVQRGTPLWYVVLIDTSLMLWRFLHRYIMVSRVYGRRAGLLSIPRLPVSNIVNFFATLRALRQYAGARLRKKTITWDKTAHAFPEVQETPSV